ncbi:MAG: metallophosphoesterase family protein [Planctomycetota bacterium]|jgi:3',5'-cyclic AMP phosphodiesterase CpdA
MKIVLLGDVHVHHLWPRPWQMLSKRVLGVTNLWLNRRRHFNLDLLDPLIERLGSVAPDMILGSGDLTTTALPPEFRTARERFDPLFRSARTILVPGNHDRYTFTSKRNRDFETAFAPYTTTDWPLVQRVGERLVVIGLDPTRPNFITDRGRLPDDQLRELRIAIEQLDTDDRLIVLCHYTLGTPPGSPPEAERHAMINAEAVVDVLAGAPEVLYLHGHVHRPWCWRHEGAPNVVAINAGAPLHRSRDWPEGQGFWVIEPPKDRPDTPSDIDLAVGIDSLDEVFEDLESSGPETLPDEPGSLGAWTLTRHAMRDGAWVEQRVEPPPDPGAVAAIQPFGSPS